MPKLPTLKFRLSTLNTARVRVLETKAGATQRIRGRRWLAIRQRIAQRDGYQCQHCARPWDGSVDQVDHIVPLEQGGSHHDDNLQLLCNACHKVKSGQERR